MRGFPSGLGFWMISPTEVGRTEGGDCLIRVLKGRSPQWFHAEVRRGIPATPQLVAVPDRANHSEPVANAGAETDAGSLGMVSGHHGGFLEPAACSE